MVIRLFSPQVRGWSYEVWYLESSDNVFPAGAGVIPFLFLFLEEVLSFPRRCGGDPHLSNSHWLFVMFSPQVRGWSSDCNISYRWALVFPAGAGVILWKWNNCSSFSGFPRRCGGDPLMFLFSLYQQLFSPQVRGWSQLHRAIRVPSYVFPAGAGVILDLTLLYFL